MFKINRRHASEIFFFRMFQNISEPIYSETGIHENHHLYGILEIIIDGKAVCLSEFGHSLV